MRSKKPITKIDNKVAKRPEKTYPEEKQPPGKLTVAYVASFRPEVILNFSQQRLPFEKIWADYGITVKGSRLQRLTGFDSANYNNAKKGRRKIKPDHLIAACLLSRVSVQEAYDAFHLCEDVLDLTDYGTEAAVLSCLLHDMWQGGPEHGYDELIWYTIKSNTRKGIVTLPESHRNHLKWQKMQHDIDYDRITIDLVRRNQKL